MKKHYPVRIELRALLEEYAQLEMAMWDAMERKMGEDKCSRCAYHVCPDLVKAKDRVIEDIVKLFAERFAVGMLVHRDKVIETLEKE